MRIESFKITPLPNSHLHQVSKWISLLLIRLYAYALRLYPTDFRVEFGDEMLDVFAMAMRETRGILEFLAIVWREVAFLPMNVIDAHQRKFRMPTSERGVWRTRQITRWSSLILSFLILHSLINPFIAPQTFAMDRLRLSIFFALLFITATSMLLAWRWERLGGLLTMGSGIGLGLFLIFYIGYFRPVEISFIGLILIGILWALPFVAFGFMFYQLSHIPNRSRQLAK